MRNRVRPLSLVIKGQLQQPLCNGLLSSKGYLHAGSTKDGPFRSFTLLNISGENRIP